MGITVAIPVGPELQHQTYLQECLDSVAAQSYLPEEVLLIDDMAGLSGANGCHVWRAPWRLGVAQAFNFGVALAANELVFMLGADDKMMPNCVEECIKAYERNRRQDAYYWVGVRYSDGRDDQYQPCNEAMVTKGFWRLTGGFPPESSVGANDCALISILIGNHMGHLLYCVNDKEPLVWYRVGENTDTARRGSWQGVILESRDLLTCQWKQPQWGRYA